MDRRPHPVVESFFSAIGRVAEAAAVSAADHAATEGRKLLRRAEEELARRQGRVRALEASCKTCSHPKRKHKAGICLDCDCAGFRT